MKPRGIKTGLRVCEYLFELFEENEQRAMARQKPFTDEELTVMVCEEFKGTKTELWHNAGKKSILKERENYNRQILWKMNNPYCKLISFRYVNGKAVSPRDLRIVLTPQQRKSYFSYYDKNHGTDWTTIDKRYARLKKHKLIQPNFPIEYTNKKWGKK